MSKIDYEAYLKQINLADITSKQEDKIKQYLEEQCKTDDALKAVYNPEKIKDCYNFIFECAKKVAHGNSSVIEDAVVYKMARDYFIEILPAIPETTDDQSEQKAETENKKAEKKNKTEQKAEEKTVDITPAVETVKEVAQQIEKDATSDNVKRDEYGFEVFEEETDEPEEVEEETVEEPCHQDEVGEVLDMADKAVSDVAKACGAHAKERAPEVSKEVQAMADVSAEVVYDEDGNGLLFGF